MITLLENNLLPWEEILFFTGLAVIMENILDAWRGGHLENWLLLRLEVQDGFLCGYDSGDAGRLEFTGRHLLPYHVSESFWSGVAPGLRQPLLNECDSNIKSSFSDNKIICQ